MLRHPCLCPTSRNTDSEGKRQLPKATSHIRGRAPFHAPCQAPAAICFWLSYTTGCWAPGGAVSLHQQLSLLTDGLFSSRTHGGPFKEERHLRQLRPPWSPDPLRSFQDAHLHITDSQTPLGLPHPVHLPVPYTQEPEAGSRAVWVQAARALQKGEGGSGCPGWDQRVGRYPS